MNYLSKFKTVFKKEFLYVVSDRRTLIISILTSSLIFPLLFGGIFFIEQLQQDRSEEISTKIGITQELESDPFVTSIPTDENFEIITIQSSLEALQNGEIFGAIEKDTTNGITNYTYLYSEASNDSTRSINQVAMLFESFVASNEEAQLNELGTSKLELSPFVFSTDTLQQRLGSESSGELLSFLLPYFILIALVQSSVQYAVEMTAGEKERSTLATTLSMNVPVSLIAFAKISVTLLLSLFFLVLNLGSMLFALLVGLSELEELSFSIDLSTIAQLALVMLPLSFLISSVMILLGIYARNQKEGQTYAIPLIFGSMFIAFSGSLFDVSTPLYIFAIPFVGHVAALRQIILGSFILPNILLLSITTIILFFVAIFAVTKLFKREEVLFRM